MASLEAMLRVGVPLRKCPGLQFPTYLSSSGRSSVVVHNYSSISPKLQPNSPFSLRSLSNPTRSWTSRSGVLANAKKSKENVPAVNEKQQQDAGDEEVEVELSWVEEKAEDLAQYVSTAVKAVPGPRVGDGDLPWLLAAPLGYLAITFVIAVVKTARRLSSPREKRRRQVGKNAYLCESLDEYLPSTREQFTAKKFQELAQKCKFDAEAVLRKYIRYALNERPFDPELVADLIHLRKVSNLADSSVVEVLNEVSRRIVKAKGPVIMDTTGFTEKGLKRKVAVQALFSKLLYLAELDEFCSTSDRSALNIKEIFGVTSDDANSIRIETLSGTSDVESLEEMVGSPSDSESTDFS